MADTINGPSLLLQVHTVLQGLTYTEHAETGRKPAVWFLGTNSEYSDEVIELMGRIREGTVEYENTGLVLSDTFVIEIVIRTHVPGVDGPTALARAIELADIVQAGFRNQSTGKPTSLSVNGDLYRIHEYELEPVTVGDEGWGFNYPLFLRIENRI